jgi:cytochrome c oxidase assembly factor CtaG
LALIRNGWGISAREDQEIAGLLMWIPGSLPYLLAALGVTLFWMRSSRAEAAAKDMESSNARGRAEMTTF